MAQTDLPRSARPATSATGQKQALFDVNVPEIAPQPHAPRFIGPTGCGKSTLLRCLNRMNDLIDGARVEGAITIARPGHLRAATWM